MEALYQFAAQLGLDYTFFYLFPLFFVLYLVLSAAYLKPYQKLLQHRRAQTEGVKKEAQELMLKAEEKYNQYQKQLKEINEHAKMIYRESQDFARREEAQVVGEASTKAKTLLQNSQTQLATQHKSMLEELAPSVNHIASEIATKVLGRSLNA